MKSSSDEHSWPPSAHCRRASEWRCFWRQTNPASGDSLVDELLGLTGDPQRDRLCRTVERLLDQKWGDLLRNNRQKVRRNRNVGVRQLDPRVSARKQADGSVVREIIMARGSIYQNGQANYYKVSSKPTELAETTSHVFLGVRLQCAQCHQHPFESV